MNMYVKKICVFAMALLYVIGMQGCSKSMNDSGADVGEQITFSSEEAFESALFTTDEGLKWCSDQEAVVFEGVRCMSGKEVWNTFYDLVKEGGIASVLCAHYFTLEGVNMSTATYEAEKDTYPSLSFSLISYDGNEFRIRSRASNEETIESDVKYKYLLHFEGENSSKAQHKYYDEYYLVNDPSVTREQIRQSVYSSQAEAWIEHSTVYCDWYD